LQHRGHRFHGWSGTKTPYGGGAKALHHNYQAGVPQLESLRAATKDPS